MNVAVILVVFLLAVLHLVSASLPPEDCDGTLCHMSLEEEDEEDDEGVEATEPCSHCPSGRESSSLPSPPTLLGEKLAVEPDVVLSSWESLFDADVVEEAQRIDLDEMALVPAGPFSMGTSHVALPGDGEATPHDVSTGAFYMDVYEVSNVQFAKFVTATGYRTETESRFGWTFVFDQFLDEETDAESTQSVQGAPWWVQVFGADWMHPEGVRGDIRRRGLHPVVHVSYNDASEFCRWHGKRLPTEIEWEKAARGGLQGRDFPWGNRPTPGGEHRMNIWQGTFPEENTAEDGYLGTAPVNAYPPNGYGLFNTVGNVWEWTTSYFSTIPVKYPAKSETLVCKGGSYICHESYCYRYRIAARTGNAPDTSTGNLGFRCAKPVAIEDSAASGTS